tara:strand:- start:1065 stop:1601 length:537 start_codon:yes stop_codon:yes gene_type:complete
MMKFEQHADVERAMHFMEANNVSFIDNVYRPLSESYFEFFREARKSYKEGNLNVSSLDAQVLETDLGEMADYQGEDVPLDCPLVEEAEPELNKPKRGGPKKFYVYVKDPSTGNVKKVTWGDTTGLKTKINDVAARKSFAARFKCDTRNDKTKPSYWACRLPRYAKMLGMQVDNPSSWW